MLTETTNSAVAERVSGFVEQYATDNPEPGFETRRAHPRYQMPEPVDIMLDNAETPAEVIFATGRDISIGGIGVYANRPIPPGTEMVVGIDNGTSRLLTKAVSVHNTLSVGLFKVGARFIV